MPAEGRRGIDHGSPSELNKSLSRNGDRHLAADLHRGENRHLLGACPHSGIGSGPCHARFSSAVASAFLRAGLHACTLIGIVTHGRAGGNRGGRSWK